LKKWFLWKIIKISTLNRIIVSIRTIFSDQLYSRSDGEVANIWLVLAHIASLAPPGLPAAILLEAARFAFDYMIVRDCAIWFNLKG
jgi:hypothetical protein